MTSRWAIPNRVPPTWPREFPRPPCFSERGWVIWIDAARYAATDAELRAMERGRCPSPCQDCVAESEHRQRALRAGTCIPVGPTEEEICAAR